MYSSYGIAYDGVASWSFGNELAGHVVIFGVDNSLLSHTDNPKNNFLEFDEEPTDDINGSVSAAVKKV